jgi:tetratricopeptide (TPR) repeat protein
MENRETYIEGLIEVGDRLDDEGKTDEALECWRTVVKTERHAIFLSRFGRLAMKAERWEEALEAFLEAVDLDPNLPEAYQYLTVWYQQQSSLEKALFYATKSLSIEKSAPAYTLLGGVQLGLNMVDRARESFSNALKMDPNYEEAYFFLGLTYAENESQRAVELFQKAVDLDPNYAVAHLELGWALRRLLKYPEAEYHLRRTTQLDASICWAHVYLGNTLWAQRDLPAAEESFKRSMEVWPNDSTPYWALAIFYEYEGRSDEAEKLYLQALQIDPHDPVANNSFGKYLRDSGRSEVASLYIERALALNPDDRAIESVLSGFAE